MTHAQPLRKDPASVPGWPAAPALPRSFFDRDALELARSLVGMVLRRRYKGLWLSARIIETEAYYLADKGSHASLGYTAKRRALFEEKGGMIYMYYARGGDSLNISAAGAGNAVLIKSAHPWQDVRSGPDALACMQALNPRADGTPRPPHQLCSGQVLLCRALGLKVPDWDGRFFNEEFHIEDVGMSPHTLLQTTRLGIPTGRDEHLPYRFVDLDFARHATRNPLRRGQVEGEHYTRVIVREA